MQCCESVDRTWRCDTSSVSLEVVKSVLRIVKVKLHNIHIRANQQAYVIEKYMYLYTYAMKLYVCE